MIVRTEIERYFWHDIFQSKINTVKGAQDHCDSLALQNYLKRFIIDLYGLIKRAAPDMWFELLGYCTHFSGIGVVGGRNSSQR